jgi:hypothetical protein
MKRAENLGKDSHNNITCLLNAHHVPGTVLGLILWNAGVIFVVDEEVSFSESK